jgi:hypothetical protein
LSKNVSFPFVTLPNFERKAAYTIQLAQVLSLMIFPIVQAEQRPEWECYSVENQGWLSEGLSLQTNVDLEGEAEGVSQLNGQAIGGTLERDPYVDPSIPPFIFSIDPQTTAAVMETGKGPYAPIWQIAPAIPVPVIINFNVFQHPSYIESIFAFMEAQTTLLSRASDFTDDSDPGTAERKAVTNLFMNRWPSKAEYEDGPISDLYIPIWDGLGEDRKLAGIMNIRTYS